MGTRRFLYYALAIATLGWAGCSDDSGGGDGDSDDDGGGQTLEPGREVAGCFDCSATEYCMIFTGGETDTFRCAEASCGLECPCIEGDGKKRHAECESAGSCQAGSGLLYCAG